MNASSSRRPLTGLLILAMQLVVGCSGGGPNNRSEPVIQGKAVAGRPGDEAKLTKVVVNGARVEITRVDGSTTTMDGVDPNQTIVVEAPGKIEITDSQGTRVIDPRAIPAPGSSQIPAGGPAAPGTSAGGGGSGGGGPGSSAAARPDEGNGGEADPDPSDAADGDGLPLADDPGAEEADGGGAAANRDRDADPAEDDDRDPDDDDGDGDGDGDGDEPDQDAPDTRMGERIDDEFTSATLDSTDYDDAGVRAD